MKRAPNKNYAWDLFWLGLLIASVFFLFLGVPPLNPPDEPRYAEIPREMLAMHQFIIPHLNGLIYFEKPPLAYWLVAGFMKLFGYSEWAVRASVATMGTLGCLATYAVSRKLFNRRTGILSALILSSSLLYFAMSRFNTTDMSVTFCLTLSLYSFLIALQSEKPTTKWLWIGYFFAGLAMMAKGLIGIAFPAMILFIWIAFTKNWRLIKNMRIISGFLIILAVNLPWLLLAQERVPSFLHFYFIEQQILRYATPIAGREMSVATYLETLLMTTFPWVVFLPKAIKYNLNEAENTPALKKNIVFLIGWAAFITVFFAFSHSILIPYFLPIIPPLAIIIGRYLDHILLLSKKNDVIKVNALILSAINILLGVGLLIYLHCSKTEMTLLFSFTVAAFLITALVIFIGTYRTSTRNVIAFIILGSYLSFTSAWLTSCALNKHSIKPLALTINTLMKKHPNAEIVNFDFYRQDMPYYTQRIITVVGNLNKDDFNELTYGIRHDKKSQEWMINNKIFWKRWNSQKRLYVVMKLKLYKKIKGKFKKRAYVIQSTSNDILITNKQSL